MLQVDSVPARMLGQPGRSESDAVSTIFRPFEFARLRNWRALMAVLVTLAYLLSGALHGLHDIDVTHPAGHSDIASTLDTAGHQDHKALADHHCHGCFSVTVAQPAQSEAVIELVAAPNPHRDRDITGIVPETDSPPPKHQT